MQRGAQPLSLESAAWLSDGGTIWTALWAEEKAECSAGKWELALQVPTTGGGSMLFREWTSSCSHLLAPQRGQTVPRTGWPGQGRV